MKKDITTYRGKMMQANREAKAALIALAFIVVVWLVCGIGLAGSDVQVFHTPIWIVGGTVGTWIASIVATVVLVKCVFVDMSLDDASDMPENIHQLDVKNSEGEGKDCG